MKSDRAFFDAIARRYDRVYAESGAESKEGLAKVVTSLTKSSAKRVLVLGVGTGRELSALLDAGLSPVGLDFSKEMLTLCDRRTRKVPLVEADFWQPLPFDPRSFDAAIALHGTIAHPPQDDDSLTSLAQELARVLRRPGTVIVEVPTQAMANKIPELLELPDGRRMKRSGHVLTHEDTVANVAIEARLLPLEVYENALKTAGFAIDTVTNESGVASLTGALPQNSPV